MNRSRAMVAQKPVMGKSDGDWPQIDPRSPAEFVMDFGDTAERILAHAESARAELVGLGVRRAAEITTHFRNTVAYRVLLGAHCPVVTTRAAE